MPNEDFPEVWQNFIEAAIEAYVEHHNYYKRELNEGQVPIITVRFQEMLRNKEEILGDVFKFCLGVESIEGLYIEERIKRECSADASSGSIYKLKERKSPTALFNKEQVEYIKK